MNSNPLLWEQGLFLQPQHFQLEHLQLSQLQHQLCTLITPWLWGIRTLDINEAALGSGILEISRLEALFPDGASVRFPGNATLEPRAFRDAWSNPEQTLTVSLGLAPMRSAGGNLCKTDSPGNAPAECRYTAPLSPDRVPDMYGDGPAADISTMRFNLRLVFEGEQAEGLMLIPVARLRLNGERVVQDASFAPPCLNLHASDLLLRLTRTVRDSLLSRCRQLEDYKLVAGEAGSFFGASDLQGITLFCILGVLSRNAPQIVQYLECPQVHPWTIYLQLCRIAGELSVFSSGLSPLGENVRGTRLIPPYDHENLAACFTAVQEIILRLVDTLVVGPAYTFMLEQRDGAYSTVLSQEACGSYAYWLLLRSPSPEALARQARFARLVPTEELHAIVAQALPGVRLVRAEQAPAGLPRRGDTLYYNIDTGDPLWEKILRGRGLSLVLPAGIPDVTVQLAVVQR
ncbi:MAG: type VI secretion system baseplate subunit TssK [Desulfovibrionaceae bacterium]